MVFGTSAFAVPSLERLAASEHQIVLCVTQPDRPQGRGLKGAPSPIKQAAQRLHLPMIQPPRPTAAVCDGLDADVGVVASYGTLISRDLLQRFRCGLLGIHPSLLPKYRGAAPVAWALLNGEARTGVTIFQLDERLDAGPVLARCEVTIGPEEDAERLTDRLAHLGAEELLRVLTALEVGDASATPQDDAQASLAPKLTKAHGRIDWRKSAEEIHRLVRATVPWPSAHTQWRGQPLKMWAASVTHGAAPRTPSHEPGTVVQVTAQAILVATGSGVLAVRDVQPAGRRRMSAEAFIAGYHLKAGDRLG